MPIQIIEGNWDDLVSRTDLRGRRVQIAVLDDAPADTRWLARLQRWADSHQPVNHTVEDNRESIYNGTVDDPR